MAEIRRLHSVFVQARRAIVCPYVTLMACAIAVAVAVRKGDIMKKMILASAAVALLAASAIATPTPAEARGGRVAAGVIGGLAAGAIIGGALAGAPAYGYGPGYGYGYYGGAPAYYGGGPAYYGPACHWQRQRYWDGYGWVVRRVRVCP